MNRGFITSSISEFYDRLACAQVADAELLKGVLTALNLYLEDIEKSYDSIDEYTLNDLSKVYSYFHFNGKYITGSEKLDSIFTSIGDRIKNHQIFLGDNQLASEYVSSWSIDEKI